MFSPFNEPHTVITYYFHTTILPVLHYDHIIALVSELRSGFGLQVLQYT